MSDPVNHPAHYTAHASGIECIRVAEHFNFCIGNAIKYLWRAGQKGDAVQDLRKAVWYIEREISRLQNTSGDETRWIPDLCMKLTAELEKLRADHDALGNDMDSVCVERDEARESYRLAVEANKRIAAERDAARRWQTADERICAQRDEAMISRNSWRDEANRLEIKLSDVTRQLQRTKEVRCANTSPEPSRLEIAARIMQGWASNPSMESITGDPISRTISAALEIADFLIAAAKEVAK